MAVYKTKNGRWRARISYRDDYGNIKTKSKTFDLKREAQDYEVGFRQSLRLEVDGSMTFGDMVDEYINNKKATVTKETVRDQQLLLDKFTSHLYHKRMNALKRSDFFKVYDNIVASDYSWSRKNRSIMLVKAVNRYAYTRHNFNDLTIALETLPKKDGDEQVFSIWTPEEFKIFNRKVENYTLKCMFKVLYYTGMRRGEARALLKSDFNVNDKTLNINKSMRRSVVNRLKTASSRRVVKLDDETHKALIPLLEVEGDYLFGGLEPISNSMLQRTFTRAIGGLDIPNIRIHDLRHSHASYLINSGVNIVAVSKRLGHSDINTTLRRYTHLMQKSEDKLLEVLNK